ncbi:MAG: zinc-dependent peptidase [Planctomycetes bacterium]|nr:zinc-dependent peptidase [Planctomycetota bacterium]
MVFSWLRSRRRRNLLAEPYPVRWDIFIDRNVAHFKLLSSPEQDKLRDITRILIAEKRWQGRSGLFVTEEMKVTIAAQAALMLLGDDHGYFRRVRDVFVFPTEFRTPRREDDWEDDFLSETPLAGQAVYRGPVLLAWDEVHSEGTNPAKGTNVVIHEFAHQLDYVDGLSDGTPSLGDRALESRWREVLNAKFEEHCRAVALKRWNPLFTTHSADNEAEFFASASEAFFCSPAQLKQTYSEVYQLLAAYYRLDPLMWYVGHR